MLSSLSSLRFALVARSDFFTYIQLSVFNVKRLIGSKFDDPEVQADIKQFPFKVFSRDGRPCIEIDYHGQNKQFVNQ